MFFSNINTITNQDDIVSDVNIEQMLHCNNDMILTRQDNAKFICKEKVVSIIKQYNEEIFGYVYNKFIVKHNNFKCAIALNEETQRNLKFEISTVCCLLTNRLARSDTKNKMRSVEIRGPCYRIAFLE